MPELTLPSARGAFFILTTTRWLPVGFVIGLFALLARERGLSVQETLTYTAAQGVMVVLLELPTSGFADAFGRRPVLIAAAVVNVITGALYLTASDVWHFALAAACMGVYRALDSGPLEAWYVDVALAQDPETRIEADLARQGTVTGLSIGAGALLSAAAVAWHPLERYSALALPVVVFIVLAVIHLLGTVFLVHEERPTHAGSRLRQAALSARATPRVLVSAVGLLGRNHVLAAVVAVELFWVAAMAVMESAMPLRLAEIVGGETRAGRWLGSLVACGWLVCALGAAGAACFMRRWGVARAAMAGRLLNGLGAAAMGLTFGPAAFAAAYLAAYAMHGFANAPHAALLHREADASNRATVLSINSTAAFAGGAAAPALLGLGASASSLDVAMVGAGLFSVLGAALYWPAHRMEKRQSRARREASSG